MIGVRAMSAQDCEAVSELEAEIFTRPWSRQGFLDALKQRGTVFLVAEEDGQIRGYAGMYFSCDEGEITNVAVSETARGRGIGDLLIRELKRKAGEADIVRLVLEVRVSNRNAIRLYEKNGFIRCGIRKKFYEAPEEDAYIMSYGQ